MTMTMPMTATPLDQEGQRGCQAFKVPGKLGFSGYFKHKAPGKSEDLGCPE